MKTNPWRILTALLVVSFVVVWPVAARPAPTPCSDVLSHTVIRGDLLVPELAHCELNNVTVRGDVRLHHRSGFTPYDSRIDGAITGAQFELVQALNTHIAGDLRLRDGVTVEIGNTTIAGDARISGTGDTRVLHSRVHGTLVIRAAADRMEVCGSTVGGDARFAGNSGWVFVGGDVAECTGNAVRGHLRVHHNQQQITIANNIVGQNLVCAANEPAPAVYANQVGGTARGQCGAGELVDARELDDAE